MASEIHYTPKERIENLLVDALSGREKVAIVVTEPELDTLIDALEVAYTHAYKTNRPRYKKLLEFTQDLHKLKTAFE